MAEELSQTQLDDLRRLLVEKRTTLAGDVIAIKSMLDQENEMAVADGMSSLPTHQADVASDVFERDLNAQTVVRERGRLGEIDQALDRMDQGTYGLCLECGQSIGEKRLLAKPWAKYCLPHAALEPG